MAVQINDDFSNNSTQLRIAIYSADDAEVAYDNAYQEVKDLAEEQTTTFKIYGVEQKVLADDYILVTIYYRLN